MATWMNIGTLDRIIRVVLGGVLLYVGYAMLTGAAQIVLYVIGAVVLLTGVFGYCAAYTLLGINTCAARKA